MAWLRDSMLADRYIAEEDLEAIAVCDDLDRVDRDRRGRRAPAPAARRLALAAATADVVARATCGWVGCEGAAREVAPASRSAVFG